MVWPRILIAVSLCCAIASSSQPLLADVVNVLVLDHDVGSDAGFGTFGRYEDAYNDMLNPANFGATGVVDRTFQFMSPVSSLSGVSLNNVGLVILAHSHLKSTSLDDGDKITSFMSNGGGVLALGHSFSAIEGSISQFATLSRDWTNHYANTSLTGAGYRYPVSSNMTVNSLGEGPTNGPFGDVQQQTILSDGNEYWSEGTGQFSGTFAIDYDAVGNHLENDGLYGQYGAGRYMMIGSVNMIGDGDVGWTTMESRYREGANSEFFLNTIDYLTAGLSTSGASGTTSTPEPSSLVFLAAAGAAIIVSKRKRRGQASRHAAI